MHQKSWNVLEKNIDKWKRKAGKIKGANLEKNGLVEMSTTSIMSY